MVIKIRLSLLTDIWTDMKSGFKVGVYPACGFVTCTDVEVRQTLYTSIIQLYMCDDIYESDIFACLVSCAFFNRSEHIGYQEKILATVSHLF